MFLKICKWVKSSFGLDYTNTDPHFWKNFHNNALGRIENENNERK